MKEEIRKTCPVSCDLRHESVCGFVCYNCVYRVFMYIECHLTRSLSFKVAKHSRNPNLADVALAGLASKENFRKVNLRSVKSTDVVTNNSTLPFNKLMLIRIKGQKHERVVCVCFVYILYEFRCEEL